MTQIDTLPLFGFVSLENLLLGYFLEVGESLVLDFDSESFCLLIMVSEIFFFVFR